MSARRCSNRCSNRGTDALSMSLAGSGGYPTGPSRPGRARLMRD